MPKAKTKDYSGMKDAWEKIDRFPGEGGSWYNTPKGDKATPVDRRIRKIQGEMEIEDLIKNKPTSLRFDRDTPEKLKKDAEQTWNIKAREPKDSKISNMYAGGSVENRVDISSPKETLKSYTKRRKSDTDKWYIPDKTKNIDLISAKGYDIAKDQKTGLPDIKNERDPNLWGSYSPSTGRLQVRKHPFRGKSTTAHEYGHTGSTYFNDLNPDTEEMRQREMDARKDTAATSDAKDWWDSLNKGINPRSQLKLFKPLSSSDTPHVPKNNYNGKPAWEDPRHVNPMGFTYPRSEKQVNKDQIFKGLGDRDRISIEKLNDRLIDKSRKDLSQKYFRGGRESHTDTDLKKAAFGNILPYTNKEFDKKPIDPKTGNANQLNFPTTSAAMRKADTIARQKEYDELGHHSTNLKVFSRAYKTTDGKARFPDHETGNPNQLNFPKGKKIMLTFKEFREYLQEALDKPYDYIDISFQ